MGEFEDGSDLAYPQARIASEQLEQADLLVAQAEMRIEVALEMVDRAKRGVERRVDALAFRNLGQMPPPSVALLCRIFTTTFLTSLFPIRLHEGIWASCGKKIAKLSGFSGKDPPSFPS